MSSMEKIVIFGSPGSGKTTLAQKLGSRLDIEVFHLDRLFWNPGWEEKPLATRITIQQELIRANRWIMEGTYLDSSDVRLNAADTIIFLDTFFLLCLLRVFIRRIKYHNKPRLDLPQGCSEKLRWRYILKVLVFPIRGRQSFLKQKWAPRRDNEEKLLLWFRSSKEIEDFLKNCPPSCNRNVALLRL